MYCFDNSHDHRGRGCPTSTPPTSLPAQVRRAVNSAFIRHGDLHVESGHEQRDELLRLQNRPTEVFAESDLQTLGPYRPYRADRDWTADPRGPVSRRLGRPACREADRSRADDDPTLIDMAGQATPLVLTLARGECPTSTRIDLATSLVVRQSTAPIEAP